MTDFIVRIDPANGQVKSALDLSDLKKQVGVSGTDAVLNGIAYDKNGDRLFVTGKYWPKLFQVSLKAC
jgi:glutamine cyclotransferase